MHSTDRTPVFSAFIEQYVETVENSNQGLEQLAHIQADTILGGFHRSLERSYHRIKFIEAFLADICQLNDDYEAKGFAMAVNGFDVPFRSVLFLEMMRELVLTGLDDHDVDTALSMRLAIQGHYNANAIVRGYAICMALDEIKQAASESGLTIGEPDIKMKRPEKPVTARLAVDEIEEDGLGKSTHKQQILLLERLGFFELPTVQQLTAQNKGKLLSQLLNRSEKNSTEYIRNLSVPKNMVAKDAYFMKTEQNTRRVDEIINSIQLKADTIQDFVVTTGPTTTD